jgi:hypothetical protein
MHKTSYSIRNISQSLYSCKVIIERCKYHYRTLFQDPLQLIKIFKGFLTQIKKWRNHHKIGEENKKWR